MRISRPIFVVAAIAASVLGLASNTALITDEAMETYRSALKESARNKPKAAAMLKGLLVESLTVGIDRTSLPNKSFDFEEGVQLGIDLWNESLGDETFKLSPSSVTADVVVKFVPQIRDGNHTQGLVQAQRHFYWKGKESGAKLTGTIQVRDNVGKRYLRKHEIASVMAHELGHLLGLNDTPSSNGLMGDFIAGRPLQNPSSEELEAVVEFRTMVRSAMKR